MAQEMFQNQQIKKKTYLGWLSIIAAFVLVPKGTIAGVILATIALFNKDHNHTLPIIGLIFSGAILLIMLYVFI